MEIKKSSSADLDKRRWLDFLCGAVLVLASLYVALEYDWAVHDDEFDAEALENIVKELDLEALKEEERIPLIKEQVVERPQSADKLNIVDEEPEVELKDEIAPPENDVELKTVDEVNELRQVICDYYARRVDDEVEKLWESGQWDNDKNEAILSEHLRTPYNPAR